MTDGDKPYDVAGVLVISMELAAESGVLDRILLGSIRVPVGFGLDEDFLTADVASFPFDLASVLRR